MKNRLTAVSLAAVLLSSLWLQAPASARQNSSPERRGAAPTAGWHHGAMMGGWGTGGWGMMGGWGMTDGWGMGGWGPGMMGAGYGNLDLNLTKAQSDKIYAIHRNLREKQFALMDRMHDTMQSSAFYRDGKFDEQAARNAYAAAEKVHRQMFENMLDAQKQVDGVLTPQQRQQLSQASR
jgi:Spy/CpxP family protein refolding chaperone